MKGKAIDLSLSTDFENSLTPCCFTDVHRIISQLYGGIYCSNSKSFEYNINDLTTTENVFLINNISLSLLYIYCILRLYKDDRCERQLCRVASEPENQHIAAKAL